MFSPYRAIKRRERDAKLRLRWRKATVALLRSTGYASAAQMLQARWRLLKSERSAIKKKPKSSMISST